MKIRSPLHNLWGSISLSLSGKIAWDGDQNGKKGGKRGKKKGRGKREEKKEEEKREKKGRGMHEISPCAKDCSVKGQILDSEADFFKF